MKGTKLILVIHLAFWAMVIALPWFMMSGNIEQPGFFEGRYYLRLLSGGLLFYITYLYLVPRFYLNNRRAEFYLAVSVSILFFLGATELLSQWLFPDDLLRQKIDLITQKLASEGIQFHAPPPSLRYFNAALISVLIAIFALGLRLTRAYSEKEKQNRELEKEKLASELGLLKSQVSPHFFFNTLNNIYALTESGSPEAGNAVLKLSKMMRYVLYESEQQTNTTLDQEISFMNHYIDLMRLRLNEKVNISVDFRPHKSDIQIPPMIFISFIENAFKHGISYRDNSFVQITLKSAPETITFTCSNSNFSKKSTQGDIHSGIGLENIRKRLNLLFPDTHALSISNTPEKFEVNLRIQLKQS